MTDPDPPRPLRRLLTSVAVNILTLAVVALGVALVVAGALMQRTGDGVGTTLRSAVDTLAADRVEVSGRAAELLGALNHLGGVPVLEWTRHLNLRGEATEEWLRLFDQRASIRYGARVVTRYGVALDEVQWSDLEWVGTGRLRVWLPPPAALEHRLDMDGSRVETVERDLGAPEPAALLADAQRRALDCVADADQDAALRSAAHRAAADVASLASQFGFSQVEVLFDGEVAPAPLAAAVRATLCPLPLAGQFCAGALDRAEDPCDAVVARRDD